jgi:hypothetical protein
MRQRIVINLDEAKTNGTKLVRKRRRWPRVLAILAGLVLVIVVVAAVGGFFWWRRYQSTPAYTLALLIDAAQRNDAAEFQKLIDDDEIAKNMSASVSQKAAARYGFGVKSTVQAQIDAMLPPALQRLKPAIHDEVVKQIKEFASKSEPRPFIFLVAAVPSLVNVTNEGDTAKATANLSNRTIELGMRYDADRWKVTDFKDDVVVERVVDNVMKELPAIDTFDAKSSLLEQFMRGKPRRRRR